MCILCFYIKNYIIYYGDFMDIFVFKRYEYKYLITKDIYLKISEEIEKYLVKEKYFFSTIQTLYFDTDNYRLIRKSIEKPVYKEKLRLRCYGLNKDDGLVFFEIKKKYVGVVYKRRIKINEQNVYDYFDGKFSLDDSQISKEIDYFNNYYGNLKPKMLIIYDRYSYVHNESKLRITFDHNIRWRDYDMNLSTSLDGNKLIDDEFMIMEIKSVKSIPFWLARLLSNYKLYKSSFSKYKEAYIQKMEEENGKNIRISSIK